MGKESGFIPIDEANTRNIRFAIDLPAYIDRTKIHANPGRIENIMNLGGISNLKVETYESDRVGETPAIVGFDQQGAAYSAKLGMANKTEDNQVTRDRSNEYCSPGKNLVVRIGIQEAAARVAQTDVRSPEVWAKMFDASIKKGLRDTGNSVLLGENIKHDASLLVLHSIFQLMNNWSDFNATKSVEDYFVVSMLLTGLNKVTDLAQITRKHRLSLFMGPQLDRAALLGVKTKIQKVVKSGESKNSL